MTQYVPGTYAAAAHPEIVAAIHAAYESYGDAQADGDGLVVDMGRLPDGCRVHVYYDRSDIADENDWGLQYVIRVEIE